MTHRPDSLPQIDVALAGVAEALAALGQLPRVGADAVTTEGNAHDPQTLVPRLQALRETVAARSAEA